MGKIIKDGYIFMKYVNAGLIRKIDDIPDLKNELIALSERRTHKEMSQYALLIGEHILDFSGIEVSAEIEECFAVNRRWQSGKARFQEARDVAGVVNDLARGEGNIIKAKVLRAMGQIAATPHVRWHALAASEFAVVIVNLMHPKDFEKIREEREIQIGLMKRI